jgi:H+-transporting ATPase
MPLSCQNHFVTATNFNICALQITTLLAAIPTIGYARILDIGWEWAGVIWIYNVVTFLPMDMFKLAI